MARRWPLWVAIALGLWILYYLGVSLWDYLRVRRETARIEREILHTRAKTAALEARTEAMKDPRVAEEIRKRRLGF